MKLLVQAVDHAGDKVIQTGEFRYTLAILAPVTEEAIEQRIEQIRTSMREFLESTEVSEEVRSQYEKAIETLDQTVPEQMKANAGKRMQYYFAMGGPELGGDRYVEFSALDPETRLPGPSVALLQRSLGAGNQVTLCCDERDLMAIADNKGVYCGSQEPQRLGRANGSLLQFATAIDASDKDDLKKRVAGLEIETRPVDSTDGSGLRELVCKFGAGGTRVCRVDPARGFITPLVKELDDQDRVLREWESEDYFQPANSELWFPGTCKYREYDYSAEGLEPRVEKYEFTKDGVLLNNEIPEDRFRVAIPTKIPLIDARNEKQQRYAATEPINLSLDDLDNIAAIPGIVPDTANIVEQSPKVPLTAKNRRLSWVAWSGLLLCAVICVIFWRRGASS